MGTAGMWVAPASQVTIKTRISIIAHKWTEGRGTQVIKCPLTGGKPTDGCDLFVKSRKSSMSTEFRLAIQKSTIFKRNVTILKWGVLIHALYSHYLNKRNFVRLG